MGSIRGGYHISSKPIPAALRFPYPTAPRHFLLPLLILQKAESSAHALGHSSCEWKHPAQSAHRHALRRDQDELPADRTPSRLNHHGHTRRAVDVVHEYVELVETPDGTAHGFPDGKQQTDGRK